MQWEGDHCEPFRALLCHAAIAPVLNTILGEGYRLDAGPALGQEHKAEFHGGAVERRHSGNSEAYFFRGGRIFSGLLVVEIVLRDERPEYGGVRKRPIHIHLSAGQ